MRGTTRGAESPTERGIALAVGMGWLPFSGAWLGYESLRDAAERMSERFPCYISHAAADEGLNPNVLSIDHYQTTDVVDACRYLSSRGLRL